MELHIHISTDKFNFDLKVKELPNKAHFILKLLDPVGALPYISYHEDVISKAISIGMIIYQKISTNSGIK